MARRPFFSGNYGSALGSTANAANLIARAGETQGQMFANLGSQIGGMIQQYGLNKEKRAKLTDKIENRLKLDPSIAQRLTMSGDEDYDKKNLTLMEKLSKGEIGMKGLESLDNAMATIREVDLQKQQDQDRKQKNRMEKLLLAGQKDKIELANRLEKQRLANIGFVQQTAKELVENLSGLSGKKRQKALSSLNPKQQQIIRDLQLIEQGNIDPSNYIQSAEDALKTDISLAEYKKLLGEIEDKDTERTQAEEDERIKKDRYLTLKGQLERIQKGLAEGRLTLGNLSPDDSYILSQEDNIRLGLPLGERPDVVEVLAERKKREAEVAGFADQQKLRESGLNVSPRGVFEQTEQGTFRVGTKAESAEPPVASPVTTPPQVFNPIDARAFRGQFGPQIVDQLDRAYSYFTGKTLPGTDQKEVKKQKQNLSTIGNAITPVLLAELGGKVTNLMIERVENNIPLATDNVTVGREKIGQLVNLAKSQLSRAETFIETLNPGTQAYAEALGVKRFLEVNIPMLEQSIGADRPSFSDPSIERILGGSRKPNVMPVDPTNRSTLSTEDLLKLL